MHLALWLLLIAGPIGATDVLYFHLWKFKLYRRPQSRKEELTHLIRGAAVPAIFAMLLLGRPEGRYFWIVAALFFFDTINSLLDVMIEPASRASLGGVPPAELAVHFIGTSMMGAAWATFMIAGWATRTAPPTLAHWAPGTFPSWLASMAWGAVGMSVLLVLFEAALVMKYRRAAV
jgi:hypothetical protein